MNITFSILADPKRQSIDWSKVISQIETLTKTVIRENGVNTFVCPCNNSYEIILFDTIIQIGKKFNAKFILTPYKNVEKTISSKTKYLYTNIQREVDIIHPIQSGSILLQRSKYLLLFGENNINKYKKIINFYKKNNKQLIFLDSDYLFVNI
ncbi:TPA: hypothetical protein LA742_002800 [Clostridium botulinum]|uniref:Uncharacterized protein n=1 Tax=Clostridium sporogenes TaxID=1509 RepID=A0AAE6I9G0_CLOSG|nr:MULTISPECIES: hypothetical protein [Clostridium]APQ78647.1 hypothetical protein RSJ10_3845 [Clostridium botulinum]AUM93656.1 hypothetical protein RSJ11_00080 [Clostridium sporogenes]MBN3355893.1 hypothetical protein [Clostridium botulinum]QDY34492.1 hypothetical protein CGS26_19465 [Clostridium sporogenes]HBJ2614309.1 hypothetical protein [Clostridium botulinum]